MADSYEPPTGPPPPKVPEGWKAVWNDQYKEWFYVNVYTKKSQWVKPDEPVYPPSDLQAPDGPPPYRNSEDASSRAGAVPSEKTSLSSNNPYSRGNASSSQDLTEDEKLARKLQAEEDARAHPQQATNRGEADNFYNYNQQGAQPPYNAASSPNPYGQQQPPYQGGPMGAPPQQQYYQQADQRGSKKGGFLGKLLGKASGGQSSHSGGGHYGQGPMYGGQPQYGYGGQPGYGGMGSRPHKSGGMGTAGAAALGVGGGLVGGALLADAVHDHDQSEYQQGYDQGYDNGGGGDYGGDGGGDFGGGDFGGGDFGGGGF